MQHFVSSSRYAVMVISYEMFVRSFDVVGKLTFDLVVCDEGHRLKNTNIKTTTVCHFAISLQTAELSSPVLCA